MFILVYFLFDEGFHCQYQVHVYQSQPLWTSHSAPVLKRSYICDLAIGIFKGATDFSGLIKLFGVLANQSAEMLCICHLSSLHPSMSPWDPHQKSESNIVFLKLEQLFATLERLQRGPLIGDDHVNDSILAIHHLFSLTHEWWLLSYWDILLYLFRWTIPAWADLTCWAAHTMVTPSAMAPCPACPCQLMGTRRRTPVNSVIPACIATPPPSLLWCHLIPP